MIDESMEQLSEPRLPRTFVGQVAAWQRLNELIGYCQTQGQPLPHILLCGSKGMGKRTIATCVATLMDKELTLTVGTSLKTEADLMGPLVNLKEGDILAITELDRLPAVVQNLLLDALTDFKVNFTLDKGFKVTKPLPFKLERFICIATTEQPERLSEPLLRAFLVKITLESYQESELERIVRDTYPELTSTDAQDLIAVSDRTLADVLQIADQFIRFRGSDADMTARQFFDLTGITPLHADMVSMKDLTGVTFERKILSLLKSKELRPQMTRRSGDGGVDIVAYDDDLLVGGKYVVQCKDWINPVGVNVVREFCSVVDHENAVRGILVTTSTFTSEAIAWAHGKRVTLIDGRTLQNLLQAVGDAKDSGQ